MNKKFSLSTLACLPLIACGSDTHKINIADSNNKVFMDAPPVTCKAQASYSPSFGSGAQQAENLPATTGSAAHGHIEFYDGLMMGSDVLDISLYAKVGGFGSGDIVTGNYPLTGVDADWPGCGVCVAVLPENLDGSGKLNFSTAYLMTEQYMAVGGSMTLTSVNGTITGSLSNVNFKHINLDAQLSNQTFPDSCVTTIPSASFTATLVQGSAAFVGTMDNGQKIRLSRRYR